MKVTPFTRDLLKAYREEKAKLSAAEQGMGQYREFVATINGKPTETLARLQAEADEKIAQGNRQG